MTPPSRSHAWFMFPPSLQLPSHFKTHGRHTWLGTCLAVATCIAGLSTLGPVGIAQAAAASAPATSANEGAAGAVAATTLDNKTLQRAVQKELGRTVKAFRWFHQHPELSFEENDTAAYLAKELKSLDMTVKKGVGKTGLLGVLTNRKHPQGPVVMYRADMDGLPVAEATGLPYASTRPGLMHACGHDVHMATALGTLRLLAANPDWWRGTVVFVGQPAEELGAGAQRMVQDRAFGRLMRKVGKPTVALALHTKPKFASGDVALLGGWVNANVDSVDITLHGKGGHGAHPDGAVDPIVMGAQVVTALQTIVSRRLPPGTPAVVTVGKFAAGSKHNVIAPTAELLLTVRSYEPNVRAQLLQEIEHIARSIATAHRAPKMPEVRVQDPYLPAAYNDPSWNDRLVSVFESVLGEEHVHTHTPSLGGEDFGVFARHLGIPGVMYRLGTTHPKLLVRAKKAAKQNDGNPGKHSIPGLHSDKFRVDPEPTLRTGVLTMVSAIVDATASTVGAR